MVKFAVKLTNLLTTSLDDCTFDGIDFGSDEFAFDGDESDGLNEKLNMIEMNWNYIKLH